MTRARSGDSAILCVGLNPALDVTQRVSSLTAGTTHRVTTTTTTAGGKAANVCRVAATLGTRAHLVVPAGGPSGREFARLAGASKLSTTVVPITGLTRHTWTIVTDAGRATGLNQAGPQLSQDEFEATFDCVDSLLTQGLPSGSARRVGILVISGSVPPGAPDDAVATLTRLGRAHGIPVVVDTSGAQLVAALEARPTVIKPNAAEVREVTGWGGLKGARALAALSPGTVVVASNGSRGLTVIDSDGLYLRGVPAQEIVGNPTGAGDACVAAIATGLLREDPWPLIVRRAVGASAAAVRQPTAGVVDLADVRALVDAATVEDLSSGAPLRRALRDD